jgi:hypothetical protein
MMDKKLLRDVVPILISAVALIISIKSCAISQRATSISSSEYQLSRSLVLTGSFSEDQNECKLKPLSEDMKVITLTIYTPSKVSEKEVIFERGFELERYPLVSLTESDIKRIKELIIKNHQEHDCNEFQEFVFITSRIPILIETSYLVKGDKVSDASIYTMKYQFYRSRDKNRKTWFSTVLFANLEFDTHLAPENWRNILRNLRSGKPWVLRFDGKRTILRSDRLDEEPKFIKFDGVNVIQRKTEGDSNK